jgi:hypothetical protein
VEAATAYQTMLWTAIGAIAMVIVQLFYLAFRFGKIDSDIQTLKGSLSELRGIVIEHITEENRRNGERQ